MTHQGNDIYLYHYDDSAYCGQSNINWPGKNASAGSPYFTVKGRTDVLGTYNLYANISPIFEYPTVPYCGHDFRCRKRADNLNDLFTGWIVGATDDEPSLQELDTSKEYVRQRIADFLTEIMSVGITGFSVSYDKYIDPDDYIEIFKKFRYNLGNDSLPIDFIGIIEIQIGNIDGEFERLLCDSNYHNFGKYFEEKLEETFPSEDVFKFKIEVEDKIDPFCKKNENPQMQRYSWSLENQEIQKHGSGGIKEKFTDIEEHYNKYSEMLRDMKEIKIRKIFSSYSLPYNGGNGFPDGKSDCRNMTGCIIVGGNGCTCEGKNVPYVKAFERFSTGYDTNDSEHWIYGNYTRVHRRMPIINAMREWEGLPQLTESELFDIMNSTVEEYIKMTIPTTIPTIISTTILTTIPTTILTSIPTTILTSIPTTITTNTILTTIPTTILTTIPTTILTTIPTTIPTTILTTIPTTIPTTILTTIPTTIITTISTTIPTNFLTTIPTIIPTTIPKTIPSSILTTIPTTIPITILNTIPTKISTTIPTKFPTTITTSIPEVLSTIIPKDLINTTLDIPPTSIISTMITFHCLVHYISYDEEKNIHSYLCLQYKLIEVKDNIIDMIDNIDIYKKYIIYTKDYVAKITPIDYVNQGINSEIFFPSVNADFSECENILRTNKGIPSPNKITFIQIEVNNTIDNILVNQVEYAAYYG